MTADAGRAEPASRRNRRLGVGVALGLLMLLALLVRSLGIERVFPENGEILLELHDASYHARRALFSFVNFPSVLFFDRYLAFPDGAQVPFPPLYDWALAGVARLFGDDLGTFERVAAWSSPVLGALTVPAAFGLGRLLGGTGVGLGAAALFALLPVHATFSRIGNVDHHAAVSLLAALWLTLAAQMVSLARDRRVLGNTLAQALVCAGLVLTWSGSLFYVVLGEASILLVAGVVAGRRDLVVAQALAALGAAALVAPWVIAQGEAAAFASTRLSWLQVVALVGASALALSWAGVEWLRPARGIVQRGLRASGLVLALLLMALAVPALREALAPGAGFLVKADDWAAWNPEQRPLFSSGIAGPSAMQMYGAFAYLIPLAPLVPLWGLRDRRRREPALLFALWAAALAVLAVAQLRFGTDFAVLGSVAFALLLARLREVLVGRARVAAPVAAAAAGLVGLVLFAPALNGPQLRKLGPSLAHLGWLDSEPPTHLSPKRSLLRFAGEIRRVTPETAGYFDPDALPEYSVLSFAGFGHVIRYAARRPAPVGNFGPYVDAGKYRAVQTFYRSSSEAEALAIAEALGARYVLTAAAAALRPPRLDHHLHRLDGSASGEGRHLERFRLITEGPERGLPHARLFPEGLPARSVPYKLFEIVEGALLSARGEPGAELEARLFLHTPLGRRFRFRATARADAEGRVRLRVPYPTDASAPTRAEAAWRVSFQGETHDVEVSDTDVRRGAVIDVPPAHGTAAYGP